MNQGMNLEHVDCPVCGPSRTRVWLEDGKPTRYVRCLTCGTVYASPRSSRAQRFAWLDDNFSLCSDIFDLTKTRLPALQLEAGFIKGHVRQGRILDVGCSIGAFFDFFPASQWKRYGVELSPSAAEYAAKTYAAQVTVGSLKDAYYPDIYFDLVTLIDTLYYVDDPFSELSEMHRILRPGGWLGIEIAGQAYMLKRNYGLIPWLIDRRWSRAGTDSSYINWFAPAGLEKLLNKIGYKVEAWYVVPSPIRKNRVANFFIDSYFGLMDTLSKVSNTWLSWAPKYLCLASAQK